MRVIVWRTALFVATTLSHAATRAAADDAIVWSDPVEIAVAGGVRGPWRQNDSLYDYVDDPAAAISARGDIVVAWVDQLRKDVLLARPKREVEKPRNVSRTPDTFSWLPRLAFHPREPNRLFALWQEIIFSGGSHGGDILFAHSSDGGATFNEPLNLSHSIGGDGKGRINERVWDNGSLDLAVAPSGEIYAAWTEYHGALWLAVSTDARRFSPAMRMADEAPARAPSLAVGADGAVYLAWTVGESASADIRIAASADRGRGFSKPVIVAPTRGFSDAPKLAIDSRGTIHLAWSESESGPFGRTDIFYSRSHDGARTFEEPRRLPLPQGARAAGFPSLSVDARNNVYVLFEHFGADDRPRGLGITWSRDAGERFTQAALIPGSEDSHGAYNGNQQGSLSKKLAVADSGAIAVVNSSFKRGERSRVWLIRGAGGGNDSSRDQSK